MRNKRVKKYLLRIMIFLVIFYYHGSTPMIAQAASNLPTPGTVDKDSLAPMNNLQIFNNMEGASVTVESYGTGVDIYQSDGNNYPQIKYIDASTESDGNSELVDKSLSQGSFWNSSDSTSIGLYNSMYKSMRAGTGDKTYGGIAILFTGSNPKADNYGTDYEAGWDQADLSLDTTTMWLELNYTNVGYYKGKKINALAKISITPSKNRNEDARWNHKAGEYDSAGNRYDYRGTYHPMLQISHSLYRGWVWQNVKEFKVDLQFYYSDGSPETPINIGNATDSTGYDELIADYYVINSLNPVRDTSSWETEYAHYIGPEYVLPNQDINQAYIVGEYTVEGTKYESNIVTEYQYMTSATVQKAYNGGTNPWADSNDAIGKAGWAQNSVLIMPAKSDTLSFTMGHLYRNEYEASGKSGVKPCTDSMWATISTQPFTVEREPINIDITKEWENDSLDDTVDSITLELWITDGDTVDEMIQEIEVTKNSEGKWTGTFSGIAKLETGQKYYVKEVKITHNGDKEEDAGNYIISGTLEIDTTTIPEKKLSDDGTYDISESFTVTNDKGSITVTKTDANGTSLSGVSFELTKVTVEADTGNWILTDQVIKGTTSDGKYTFDNLDLGYYQLTETVTRKGYIPLKEPLKIVIPYESGETKIYDLNYTIANGQTFSLPLTGGDGFDRIVILGMAMVTTAAIIILHKRKIITQKREG